MRNWTYEAAGGRDLRLDFIRGYAVFAMSVNHFGLDRSIFHPFTGGSVFLINAAEVFFFVSGMTLGLISCRKPMAEAMSRCYRRAWQVYLAVFFLAAGGALIGGELIRDVGLWRFIGTVATLQEAPFWGDVLAAYVLYLLAAPILIMLLATGRAWLSVGGVVAIYVLSQLDPEGLALPFASFRNLAANAPLFLGGMIIGWHRDTIGAWWGRFTGRYLVDGIAISIGLALLVMYATGYRWWPAMGAWMEQAELGVREYQMPIGPLLIVSVYLRCLWLLVDRCWLLLHRAFGWLVMPLGRAALTGYVAHAFMMPLTWQILDWLPLEPNTDSTLGATLVTLLFMALIYAIVQIAGAFKRWTPTPRLRHALRFVPPSVIGACILIAFFAGPLMSWEDGEEWIFEALYTELADFDTEDGALVVIGVPWVEVDDDVWRPDHEQLAVHLAEIMRDELGERRRTRVRLDPALGEPTLDPADTAHALRASPNLEVAEDADGADVIVLVVALDWEEELEAAASEIRRSLTRARDRSPSSLLVVAIE